LPVEVQARIARAEARGALVEAQIAALETQQQAVVRAAAPGSAPQRLVQLKGVGPTSTSVLLDEGLVWRAFANRRQVGGWVGFTPTPYSSGERARELGISRAGNARVQAVAVQLAWSWVRWQPESPLTQWFQTRFSRGKRQRRLGIVAVARRLLIALWRYATTGLVPTGVALKVA
jgi:transposase